MEPGAPRGRDRPVDHLPSELVTKGHGPTVVSKQSRLDARLDRRLRAFDRRGENRGIGAFGEQRDDIEQLTLLVAEPCRTRARCRAPTSDPRGRSDELGHDERHAATQAQQPRSDPTLLMPRASRRHLALNGSSLSLRTARDGREIAQHRPQRMITPQVFSVRHDEHTACAPCARPAKARKSSVAASAQWRSSSTTTVGGPSTEQAARNSANS